MYLFHDNSLSGARDIARHHPSLRDQTGKDWLIRPTKFDTPRNYLAEFIPISRLTMDDDVRGHQTKGQPRNLPILIPAQDGM